MLSWDSQMYNPFTIPLPIFWEYEIIMSLASFKRPVTCGWFLTKIVLSAEKTTWEERCRWRKHRCVFSWLLLLSDLHFTAAHKELKSLLKEHSKNLQYNTLGRWVAGSISYRLRALKTLHFYFCKFIKNKKINWNGFSKEFCKKLWKKK